MKRIMLTLLLAGLLTTAAACGSMNAAGDVKDTTPYIDGVETPAERSGKSALEKSGNAVKRAANNAVEDTKKTLDGSSWQEMIRNGKVHDTDGDLKDGENALHGKNEAIR